MHSLVLLGFMFFRVVGICSSNFFALFSLYTSYILWGLALFCQYIVQFTYKKKKITRKESFDLTMSNNMTMKDDITR